VRNPIFVTFAILFSLLVSACAVTPTAAPTQAPPPQPTTATQPTQASSASCSLRLATTTSTADSGLLDFILPDFQKKFNCHPDVIAVGTGQAIAIGAKGDADVLLVHARAQEDKFVADGNAKERFDVMYNDFIIVGPKSDPAKVASTPSAIEAFKAIAATKSPFASRGDASGTNTKELSIWASAAISPTKQIAWYNSLGQGMGDTLLFSNEKQAYTLSDRGTWLAMQSKLADLVILFGGNSLKENKDKSLLNPYGVMAVNPDKHPGVNYDKAMNFVKWITSPDTQKLIGSYGMDKFGQSLFYPNAKPAATQ
jgi:tungstate transport system substrate-binding protein